MRIKWAIIFLGFIAFAIYSPLTGIILSQKVEGADSPGLNFTLQQYKNTSYKFADNIKTVATNIAGKQLIFKKVLQVNLPQGGDACLENLSKISTSAVLCYEESDVLCQMPQVNTTNYPIKSYIRITFNLYDYIKDGHSTDLSNSLSSDISKYENTSQNFFHLYSGTNQQNCKDYSSENKTNPNNRLVTYGVDKPVGEFYDDPKDPSRKKAIEGVTLSFVPGSIIQADFDAPISLSKAIRFRDGISTDNNHRYDVIGKPFCDSASITLDPNNKFSDPSYNEESVKVKVHLSWQEFQPSINSWACKSKDFDSVVKNPSIDGTDIPMMGYIFQFDKKRILSMPGSGSVKMTPKTNSTTEFAERPKDKCPGMVLVLDDATANTGKLYSNDPGGSCGSTDNRPVYILGKVDQDKPIDNPKCLDDPSLPECIGQDPTNPNNPATTSGKTCEDTGFALGWFMCPLLRGIDDTLNALNSFIEKLLVVHTNREFCDGTDTVKNNNSIGDCNSGVKKAWTLIKNLATGVLIIILLIMVISEALGAGPFDAYTIRRALPKLVMAVIFMQISWSLAYWTINVFNDIGKGVADLMFWGFGGADKMTLSAIVTKANVGDGAFALGTVGLFGGAVGALVAAGTLTGLVWGILLLAMSALFAILTAFIVLVIRKMLLVLLLILLPLALLFWVLPATQKYWKLWHETFFGLLLMFPIIVAIISAGRIFAWVSATDQSFGDIAQFFIIIFAIFAPYFIMPKLLTMGGRIFGQLTGMVNDRSKGVFDRSKGLARDELKHQRGLGIAGDWQRGVKARREFQGRAAGLNYLRGVNDPMRNDVSDRPWRGIRSVRGRIGRASLQGNEELIERYGAHVEREELKEEQERLDTAKMQLNRETSNMERGSGALTSQPGQPPEFGANTSITHAFRAATSDHSTQEERLAALNFLTTQKATDAMRIAKAQLSSSAAGRETWTRAMNTIYSDMKKLDPGLVVDKPNFSTYHDAGDEIIAGMSGEAWRTYHDLAAQTANPDAARARYDQLAASSLRGSLDRPSAAYLGATGATTTTTPAPAATTGPVWRQRAPYSRLNTPDASGWTPLEDAYAENDAREEYNALHNNPNRTPQEESVYRQYRTNHPDW